MNSIVTEMSIIIEQIGKEKKKEDQMIYSKLPL